MNASDADAMEAGAPVLYRQAGYIAEIVLNQPATRNSMSPELLDAFHGAIALAAADASLRVVIIRGAGSCFSAGANLQKELQQPRKVPPLQPHERSHGMYEAFLSVLRLPIPTIAALSGHAVGGGFGLALCCDLRIAANSAKLGANFVRLGLTPGLGITTLLPLLVGVARANELLFTGRLIQGDEAARWGLVNEALPKEAVCQRAQQLAQQIADNAPYAVRMTKRLCQRGLRAAVEDAAFVESFAQAASLDTHDAAEGVAAFLGKRSPAFSGR